MARETLDVYIDYGSPYAYLAWARITKVHPERYAGVDVRFHPVSAGHIFKADGTRPNVTYPNQNRYLRADVDRWARRYGIPFANPESMPAYSLHAGRLHFAARANGSEAAWMAAVYDAHFNQGLDIGNVAVMTELARKQGLDFADAETHKADLAAATTEAYEKGAPGVPYAIFRGEAYWGNDRLEWVENAIQAKP